MPAFNRASRSSSGSHAGPALEPAFDGPHSAAALVMARCDRCAARGVPSESSGWVRRAWAWPVHAAGGLASWAWPRARSSAPAPSELWASFSPLLPQLLERLRQARTLAELAAFGSCGVEFLGRDGLVALDAELRAERAWLRDRFLNPLLGHAYLPFLTGTPRFLSSALSRAEPSFMPARLSAALSLASVHFLPLAGAISVAVLAAVPRVALLRGGTLVEHGRVVFVRQHVALELVAQARVVGLRLGPRAGERVRAVLTAIADLRRRDFACAYHAMFILPEVLRPPVRLWRPPAARRARPGASAPRR